MSEYHKEDEGIHFDPTENQLIKDYLSPKIDEGKQFDFIRDMDVYATEPWLLVHNMNCFFKKYEWYYFVTRTQVSENNIGRGKNAKRKIIGDTGNWKANAKEEILDEETRKPIGIKQTLTFVKSNNKKQKREDGTSASVPGSDSSWTMTEYMLLPKEDEFQGQVLCKIHEIKKSKDDHHEASASMPTYYHYHHLLRYLVSSPSEQKPINHHEYYAHASSSGKQPTNNHEYYTHASSSEQKPTNHHEYYAHASSLASSSEQKPTNHHEYYALTSASEQKPTNHHEYYTHASSSEQKPTNHHEYYAHASSSASSEQKPTNHHEYYALTSASEQKPTNHHEYSSLASSSEQQPTNNHEYYALTSASGQQPTNNHEYYALTSALEQQPININCNIEENEKDDHENPISHQQELGPAPSSENQPTHEAHCHDPEIPSMGSEKNDQVIFSQIQENDKSKNEEDHHESITYHHQHLESSSLEQQQRPINEAHRHGPETPRIGSENNDQVIKTSCLSDDESATVKERDINAPRSCGCDEKKKLKKIKHAGSEEEDKEEQSGWLHEFSSLLMKMNDSILPEVTDGVLIDNTTSFVDPDLLVQFAALRPPSSPPSSSQLS